MCNLWGEAMISYEPLFETMKKKGISSYMLGKMGFPMSNYHAMRHGKNISTHTINILCDILDCNVSDIITFVRETKENG